MTAPGTTSRVVSRRAVASLKTKTKMPALSTERHDQQHDLSTGPDGAAPLPLSADSTVVPMQGQAGGGQQDQTRPRPLNGLGRVLRGTAHAVFMAYWAAWATPRPP